MLVGDSNRFKRLGIYSSLLTRMTHEQRIAISAKLCTDILSDFAKEDTKYLTDKDADILFDCLAILQLPETKPMSSFKAAEEIIVFDSNALGQTTAAAKRKMLSELTKRSLSEVVIPSLVQLKSVLSAVHSPFVADVMAALCSQVSNRQKELPMMFASEPYVYNFFQW